MTKKILVIKIYAEGLFHKHLLKIKEQEKDRGRDKTSYAIACEIISKRVDVAGGLR